MLSQSFVTIGLDQSNENISHGWQLLLKTV
jgi:hypothetical protein